MQQQLKAEQAAQRASATTAIIKRAIQDRACLSGTYATYRMRFAPHTLGYDDEGEHVVVAFEFGGRVTGQAEWMCFSVDRLRGIQRTADPWRGGFWEGRPKLDLRDVEAAVDDTLVRQAAPARSIDGSRICRRSPPSAPLTSSRAPT
jgi:hypothetical protein